MDFSNGDYIEAKIDLSNVGDNKTKQNIFSVGEDIKTWNVNNDGTYNLHFYFPNSKTDRRMRFSVTIGEKINEKGKNYTRRCMGVLKEPFADEENVIIKFDKYGFWINGELLDESHFDLVTDSDMPEWPKEPTTYEKTYPDYFLQHFQGNIDLQFGSLQGSTRSWATYEYIKYHRNL